MRVDRLGISGFRMHRNGIITLSYEYPKSDLDPAKPFRPIYSRSNPSRSRALPPKLR
jgi:hypothetical protein